MRILIVEDDLEISDFLRQGLEDEYYAVDQAFDGENGMHLALFNNYSLLILDLSLPKKGGLEICRELRSMGNDVPIIILSAISETLSKIEMLSLGADDYVSKPFSFEELLARIKAVLRRPKAIKEEIIEIGRLVIDLGSKTIKAGKQKIYLTRKEFMLFECLLRHRGEVMGRGRIYEYVWDMNADPLSNTIDSHILSLRKKLEPPANVKLIRTVPGRGYIID